ncbi:MAG: response regulator [Sterolibacterium sp.]
MSVLHKILVVDDDPVVGKSFDRVLTSKGYAVITAQNGEEALRKIGNEHYDLVFTDIKMPGISGLEVAERVKASQPWLPVVIVTGYGSNANEARAEAAGVSAFLRKPLTPQMIEETAVMALSEHEQAIAAPPAPVSAEAATEADSAAEVKKSAREKVKDIALFFAAPFIGLAYVVAMPFAAIGMLAWFSAKALVKKAPIVKTIALFFAAPVIGLAYVVALPFVGIGMLAWLGTKALLKTK